MGRDDSVAVESLLTHDFRQKIRTYEGGDTKRDANGNYLVYLDSKGLPTVGHGHLVLDSDNLKVGDSITPEKANELFEKDLLTAAKECESNFTEKWDLIPFDKKQVLIAMHFQMGTPRVNKFIKMIEAINIQDWSKAANEMRDSKWAKEDSPHRAEDMAKIMEYEGNISEISNKNGEIGGILLQIENSTMDQFYGLNIDKVTQQINFIGKQMAGSGSSTEDEKKDDSGNNNNSNNYSWYYFYTFLLMFYEKGNCDGISFSLDIDGKIDKTKQNEHHRLKKVYYPESHLRWSTAGEVMFKADWFIKTLLYNLDPTVSKLIDNYQSFVDVSFKHKDAEDDAKDDSSSSDNKPQKASDEEWHRLWIVIDKLDETRQSTKNNDNNNNSGDNDDEAEDDDSALDRSGSDSLAESLWIEDIKFKIKIKRMNVTDDGDLKDTDVNDDESPILKEFITNINENIEKLQANCELLQDLSNVYRALIFAKFIYENNVPININMLKKIALKQKLLLKSENINFTLAAFHKTYKRSKDNIKKQVTVTREMYFEGGIDLDISNKALKVEKTDKAISETMKQMKRLLTLYTNKGKYNSNDSKDGTYVRLASEEDDAQPMVLDSSDAATTADSKNNKKGETFRIQDKGYYTLINDFVIEQLPLNIFLQSNPSGTDGSITAAISGGDKLDNIMKAAASAADDVNGDNNKGLLICEYPECNENLYWNARYTYDNKSYCKKHYNKERFVICHKCGIKMDGNKETWMTAKGAKESNKDSELQFHSKCFNCEYSDCGKSLVDSETFEFDYETNNIFCSLECLNKNKNGDNEDDRYYKCSKCNIMIDKWNCNEPLTAIKDGKVLFHKKCFACFQCDKALKSFFVYEKEVTDAKKVPTTKVDSKENENDDTDTTTTNNEEKEKENDNNNNKEFILFCSKECKHEYDGDSSENRYDSCYKCDEKIDKWNVTEELITINSRYNGGNNVMFHKRCFSCFQCNNELKSYFEITNSVITEDEEYDEEPKKSVLLCSMICKHKFDGESEKDRYIKCGKCQNNIDKWSNEKYTMIHDGKIAYHPKCFSCFKCNKDLDSYYEFDVKDDSDPTGKSLYLACSLDCQPQNAIN